MASVVSKVGVYEMETDRANEKVHFSNRNGVCRASFDVDDPSLESWIEEHKNDTVFESVRDEV